MALNYPLKHRPHLVWRALLKASVDVDRVPKAYCILHLIKHFPEVIKAVSDSNDI